MACGRIASAWCTEPGEAPTGRRTGRTEGVTEWAVIRGLLPCLIVEFGAPALNVTAEALGSDLDTWVAPLVNVVWVEA